MFEKNYKIVIRPKNKKPFFLVFNSKDEKERYIKLEYNYAKNELNRYMIANNTNRESCKENFYEKRFSFAKLSKFKPFIKGSPYWVRKGHANIEVA